jgi:hypothetical protein
MGTGVFHYQCVYYVGRRFKFVRIYVGIKGEEKKKKKSPWDLPMSYLRKDPKSDARDENGPEMA